MRVKLEKCMELMKEIPKPSNNSKVDVYTQTTLYEDFSKFSSSQNTDYSSSVYDDRLLKMIEKIEFEDNDMDPMLLKIIEEFENTD